MLIVEEDPAKKLSKRDTELRDSRRRSYAALLSHGRRRPSNNAFVNHIRTTNFAQENCFPVVKDSLDSEENEKNDQNGRESVRPEAETSAQDRPRSKRRIKQRSSRPVREATPFCPTVTTQLSGTEMRESRSLQFYRERTALEWSGSRDSRFWTELALQAVPSHPSIKHALIALGAYHEAAEMGESSEREDQLRFVRAQRQQALASLNTRFGDMSVTSILATYAVLAMVFMFTGSNEVWKVFQLQFNMLDELRERPRQIPHMEWMYISHYLEPMIDLQRSKSGHYVDLIHGLRVTPASHFFVDDVKVPVTFSSIEDAKQKLDDILRWTTYTTKQRAMSVQSTNLPRASETFLIEFISAIDRYVHENPLCEREVHNVALLKVSARLGFMMIRNILFDSNDLLFYDGYTPVFAEFADCFRGIVEYRMGTLRRETPSVSNPDGRVDHFNIDGGLLALAGHVALSWSRDPTIRRNVITDLYKLKAREGWDTPWTWAALGDMAMRLEEENRDTPPRTCRDIQAHNRVKLNMVRLWYRNVTHVQWSTYPYRADSLIDDYVAHRSCPDGKFNPEDLKGSPQMIVGRGYQKIREPWSAHDYMIMKDPNFLFLLPLI